jgi:hypothetical protein
MFSLSSLATPEVKNVTTFYFAFFFFSFTLAFFSLHVNNNMDGEMCDEFSHSLTLNIVRANYIYMGIINIVSNYLTYLTNKATMSERKKK